jgi:hypothetical protein
MLISLQFGFADVFCQIKPEQLNVKTFDASGLDWKLWGYRSNSWRMNFDFNNFTGSWAELMGVPFKMPGSVQNALKSAGILPDWNIGLNNTAQLPVILIFIRTWANLTSAIQSSLMQGTGKTESGPKARTLMCLSMLPNHHRWLW